MTLALGQVVDRIIAASPSLAGEAMPGGRRLSSLGIDSLTILTIIIDIASRHGLDLARLPEDLPTPDVVDDLVRLVNALPGHAAA